MVDLYSDGLTIGQLSKRTGVGVSTLRAWERRYRFPVPERQPSGHRRYSEHDVAAIEALSHEREQGSTLSAAIARARERAAAPRRSVFLTLRDALPDVAPVVMSRGAMLALSHAIEDEAATRAHSAVFVGAFETKRFWDGSRARWRHVATRADLTVAIAAGVRERHGTRLWVVPIDASTPMAREWAVICDSPSFAACLVGVERAGGEHGRGRQFDALWTVEPAPVRAAARTALDLATAAAPDLGTEVPPRLRQPSVATYDTLRAATSLTNRVVRYLDTPGRQP